MLDLLGKGVFILVLPIVCMCLVEGCFLSFFFAPFLKNYHHSFGKTFYRKHKILEELLKYLYF